MTILSVNILFVFAFYFNKWHLSVNILEPACREHLKNGKTYFEVLVLQLKKSKCLEAPIEKCLSLAFLQCVPWTIPWPLSQLAKGPFEDNTNIYMLLNAFLFWFLRYATLGDFCCFTVWSWSWWSIPTSVSERARLPNTCYWQGNEILIVVTVVLNGLSDVSFFLFPLTQQRVLSLPVWCKVLCANQFLACFNRD